MSPLAVARRVAGLLVAMTCGCAGTVIIDGEDGTLGAGGAGAGDGSGDPACAACSDADCGLCDDPASGLLIYRCPTLELPPGFAQCFQTGSLFHDDAYGYYVCWRCGPL